MHFPELDIAHIETSVCASLIILWENVSDKKVYFVFPPQFLLFVPDFA